MSKKAKTNVQKTTENGQQGVDPTTFGRMGELWNAGQAAGLAGPSGLVTGAGQYNTGLQSGGQAGMLALQGDTAATQQLMNPYQQQVVDATNQQWNQNDQYTMNAVNDRATQAGAFGGSRHGIATGSALAQNNMNRNQAVSGLLYGGYNDAMGRAGQLAGMGAYGAQQNANLGLGGVGSPEQWYAQQLRGGYAGPTGTTRSGAQTTFGANTEGGFKIPFFG
jgi:hypothetical protein